MGEVRPLPRHYTLSYAPSIHPRVGTPSTPSLDFLLLASHACVVDPRLVVRQLDRIDGDLSSWWWWKLKCWDPGCCGLLLLALQLAPLLALQLVLAPL